ncbi:MAG TPA: glycogen debranching protein GlgX [Candidatus Limnocylindria bacterium]|nr:glycogen debranching protein GlgX [Candidatus Limnocylindria bacterium]
MPEPNLTVWPGRPYPLGATLDAQGVNFALFSEVGQAVELCLFDEAGRETRLELPEKTGHVWHGYVPGVTAGQRYGYRVHGPWAPERGLRCLPSKLLLDPYARALDGAVARDEAVFSYHFDRPDGSVNETDSAAHVPRSLVVDPSFDWAGDQPPRRPLHETIIYETHVKGFSVRRPELPPDLRGTYAGLGHPASVEYLRGLGVTAVELLPVQQFIHDAQLLERGLRNYWGYNTIGYFAPHNEYAAARTPAGAVPEFKRMVAAFHAAGIEVILDVVYNHTAEGNHLGPLLCFRGIDNGAYYRLEPDRRSHYADYTGTGNTLNAGHSYVRQLIMDSLRYWVTEMHVDGFRFDLAATFMREEHAVERMAAFFDLIQQDPVVSQVKLIAEPWDVGEDGYQAGNFPPLWSEWNGRYRDAVRDYWRGQPRTLGEMGYRLTGSSDLYEHSARRPHASINFVTAHDGFTLADLVSYDQKHNEANGEGPIPGESHNRSWNHGVEGPTDDPAVLALRRRQQRNFLATLVLSQGVPMLLGGDELGRTQRGNNNAYCQDNETSWYDWAAADEQLLAFTRRLIALRRAHPVFRRRRWFHGRRIHGHEVTDIGWFRPTGEPMDESHWAEASTHALGLYLGGHDLGVDEQGTAIVDASFYLLFNANAEQLAFCLPARRWGRSWEPVIDTTQEDGLPAHRGRLAAGSEVACVGRSLMLLRRAG